jgi:hypothetical protein
MRCFVCPVKQKPTAPLLMHNQEVERQPPPRERDRGLGPRANPPGRPDPPRPGRVMLAELMAHSKPEFGSLIRPSESVEGDAGRPVVE